MKWTKDQERAIYTDGTDILVAAAAGSGKTAVLVERIIQKLLKKENPVNIDELLVVTFTNAAAQEMRNRVGEALESALKDNPTSNHLKKQLSLLQRAQISTLHAFCMDVVRKYSYQLDIDPGFRIADDVEADLIRQEILEELFEDWYGKGGDEQERFFGLVDRFSSDRSDVEIEKLVMGLYDFAMQNPWPEHWLQKMTDMYDVTEMDSEHNLPWMDLVKSEIQNQLNAMRKEAELALNVTRENDGPYHYAEAIDDDMEKFNQAKALVTGSWNDMYQFFQDNRKFKTLSGKKVDCDPDKKEQVKSIRNRYKKRFEDLTKKWFSRTIESYVKDLQELHPMMEQLSTLVLEFHQRFQTRKKEQALVDFADLEHFCLQILLDDDSTADNLQPSAVAEHFQHQFREILIDEYQDTNLVQETILKLITTGPDAGHLFMVGDVKQSIYRFRHAEPTLFITKYKQFAEDDNDNVRIDLARNFRSRNQVLSATNFIFRQILDEDVGEINYDQDAELIYSNLMYDELLSQDADAELLIVDQGDWEEGVAEREGDEDYRDLKKAQLEARAYAEKIKGWVGQGEKPPLQVVDKQTEQMRNIQYRDMVILLRSMSWAPTIVEELKQQGIPVYAELSTGYFEAIEVKVMLSLLKVIDNPQQDIPLASVLRSPIVGLDEEGLAQVRLAAPRESYYEALKAYVKTGDDERIETCSDFLKQLKDWRIKSRQGALSELIWQIYRETGYYDFVGGIPGGKQRQANLRALYDRARSYETTSFRGLFRFLRFIERMEERGEDLGAARALGEQEDVVRIMTIHKSKGLEFPAVIVGAMDKMFNEQDLKAKYLMHKDLGMGMKYIDPEKRIMYTTLPYNAMKVALRREMIAEEMRVLYVALTRAKEKLVMVGNVKDLAKRKEKWQMIAEEKEWTLPPYFRLDSTTYLDWVAPSLIRHQAGSPLRVDQDAEPLGVPDEIHKDESSWKITITHASQFANPDTVTKERKENLEKSVVNWEPLMEEAGDYYEEVNRRLTYQYQYEKAAFHRAKQTVTELKRQRQMKDEYSGDALVRSFQRPIMRRPRFMQEEKRLTATERGSAMHTVMQHLPFDRVLSEFDIEAFVQTLVEKDFLTQDEAEVVDVSAIAAFFETAIGQKLIKADSIIREVPFSLGLPAHEVYADWEQNVEEGEKVLLQGVVDCLVSDGNGWILLDYKTDQLPEELTDQMKQRLVDRYNVQLRMYRTAVERIWKQPVKETYLYFFDQSLLVEVE
ncbi:helicase-exonuclease AddAB subunit AddA [Salinibacillus xinjiangensis]|uniref:ATP-dependent helicase/nuclease subunit A n=1 Tax=Salinibacillus xinjiangensis TaxID=1229268 RepID=A0A6G1X7Q3_9BACI|nr:helicase-exonuclease AddAB subunit AddA [Salinibacillus xinjiangensis]MRG87033.1 helicase-exonuclease AddAB subunit AddA [Salinibacillus xinjiangensis]